MNYRQLTRDLLLMYDDTIVPSYPHSAGLSIVYPWENIALSSLAKQFFELAKSKGYTGDEEMLWSRFINGSLVRGNANNFPTIGDENNLYLDSESETLYYFKITNEILDQELFARMGAIVSGQDDDSIYLYLPIQALPIEDLIIDCGSAAEHMG